jgi:hypothetical protein
VWGTRDGQPSFIVDIRYLRPSRHALRTECDRRLTRQPAQ